MVIAITQTLKKARIRKGMFQKEIAVSIGITENAYSQIERGKRTTSGKTASRICSVLNADFDSLFRIKDGEN